MRYNVGMRTSAPNLYGSLAWVFPLFTPLKTYRQETAYFVKLIRQHARRPVRTLLHLGCGGGHNDFFFKRSMKVSGVDLSPAMLRRARALNPEADYRTGDYRSVRLGRTFDAVACVDSLDYTIGLRDLASVFRTAYEHLAPGGIFFFLFETTRETYRPDRIYSWTAQAGGRTGAFAEANFAPIRNGTAYEKAMVFLIKKGDKITTHTDVHRFGLFRRDDVLKTLRRTGFKAESRSYKPCAEAVELGGTDRDGTYIMFFAVRPQDPIPTGGR